VKDLSGKIGFITGAASGIGLGIAKALVRAGAKAMLCDIDETALATAVDALKRAGGDVAGVRADVSLKAELQRAAEATVARYGAVNILVNNAGVGGGGPYGGWTDAEWEWTIGVNLMAAVWGIEIFAPMIEKTGGPGHIVSTASIASLVSPSSSAYGVTKYAVVALSEGLRRELAPRGIGVSVLCPGFVRTRIMEYHRSLPDRFDRELQAAVAAGLKSDLAKPALASVAAGADPDYVGELVREGIEGDWPYIFVDTEFEPYVDARFAAIKAGFDQIRGRQAKR
jgi:NAD(P)-dependent dehydrogenase (short-subunit alcohol dehydrogenase family)